MHLTLVKRPRSSNRTNKRVVFIFQLNLLVSAPRNQHTSFYMLGMLLDMLALQQFSFIQDSNLSPVLLRFLVCDKEKTVTKNNLD